MSADENVISVRNLRTAFGAQVVHDGLNVDVKKGEILGVVGGSGSGKSVLMRAILGLLRPASGSIRVLGIDPHSERAHDEAHIERHTGVLYQGGALFSSLSVLDNVAMPMREHYKELDPALMRALALLKIRLVGLNREAAGKFPSQPSGGMRKRAGIARALSLDPDLLFLDEPTAGLDPISAAAFDKLIRTLQQALGLTVFLITHDLDTLYTVCDRIAVIAEKKILVCGRLEEVERYDHPWVQEYFHGPRSRTKA